VSNPRFLSADDGQVVMRARSMKYRVSTTSKTTELVGPAKLTLTARLEQDVWKIARLEVR
jgi:hypothetical protein